MQYFYINQGSINPVLRLDLIIDGRYDFMKSTIYNESIQNTSSIYFSMINEDGQLTVSKGICNLVLVDKDTCNERYVIEYQWKQRDTKKMGKYKGKIEINFNGDTIDESLGEGALPSGNLIVPIYEDITIIVK